MATDKTSRDYVVCPCRKVTRGEVEDIVREQHISNLKDLCAAANAGNKCGGCRETLEQIMNEVLAAM
ncbi:MAG: (2Fe-2S)-binding protein [Firmicutes bacterium]|nr:(2Fe-2S)-binding protein [Bacillota bacterium]MDD7601037.1 (2Fe-2S)-binding protein [Bacillota bacterium]MDY5856056.1 (2Fe-2S)-binding protein [Anaerovoracaceae bacterium]